MPQRSEWPDESWRIGTTVYCRRAGVGEYERFDVLNEHVLNQNPCGKGRWQVVDDTILHSLEVIQIPQFGSEEDLDAFLNEFEEITRLELRNKFKKT